MAPREWLAKDRHEATRLAGEIYAREAEAFGLPPDLVGKQVWMDTVGRWMTFRGVMFDFPDRPNEYRYRFTTDPDEHLLQNWNEKDKDGVRVRMRVSQQYVERVLRDPRNAHLLGQDPGPQP
jgi:hypothetical protein